MAVCRAQRSNNSWASSEKYFLLYDVFTGIPGPRRDIVLLNAAAALVAAGLGADLKEGVGRGAEAIDSGQAAATLAKFGNLARSTQSR